MNPVLNTAAAFFSKELNEDLNYAVDIEKLIEDAETHAKVEVLKFGTKVLCGNDRQYAQSLHSEADDLYHSGNYEAALVLYNRAARLCPRDSSHSVAARRTAAAITSWNSSTKSFRKMFLKPKNKSEFAVPLGPEFTIAKTLSILKESPDPSFIFQILRYTENHRSLRNASKITMPRIHPSCPRMKSIPLRNSVSETLTNDEDSFDSDDMKSARRTAKKLLSMPSSLQDSHQYQIFACQFLAQIYILLGRHDKAVQYASRMVYIAKIVGNMVNILHSFVTLGKVHLSFCHFDTAARAWEHLARDIDEPIARAWIEHEIGRCHLETGKYGKALERATGCIEAAKKVNSVKWHVYGKLLCGQTLLKLGKLKDARDAFDSCTEFIEEGRDKIMFSYIQDLMRQISYILKKVVSKCEGLPLSLEPLDVCSENEALLEEEENSQYTECVASETHQLTVEMPAEAEVAKRQQPTSFYEDLRTLCADESLSSGKCEEEKCAGAPRGDITYRVKNTHRLIEQDNVSSRFRAIKDT